MMKFNQMMKFIKMMKFILMLVTVNDQCNADSLLNFNCKNKRCISDILGLYKFILTFLTNSV